MIIKENILNNGWHIIKFSDCIKQLNTGLNPRNNFSLGSGKLKYITAKNLTKFGTIDFSKCDFIDEDAKKIIHKRSDIRRGDILFSSRAPIGHCHLITEDPDFYDIGESIFSIRVNQDVALPEYLCLYLASDYFVKVASKHTTGSIIMEIRISDLMNTEIIIPPREIQKNIAKCLNKIDRKIELNKMVNDYLSGEFEVTAFNDGMSAIQKITSYDEYALALIDLMLPDISGMEIIKIIRKVSKIPIIIITAKDNDIDKSLGLNLGADDYVVKPFSLIELTARIKANIRRARTYQALPNNSIIKIKDIEIDPHSHMVQRKGVTIDLTPIEFQILYILASHPGQAYSKERLYELIWKEPYFGNENVLNTHINRLRLKLKSNAEDSTAYVKTLWGIGYKMEEK